MTNSYFGSKNAIYQRIINLIPRHRFYGEPFAGSAAIGRHLLPAEHRHFIERDPKQCEWLKRRLLPSDVIECRDALPVLANGCLVEPDAFMFIDPPYPISDRRDPRARYRCEMTDEQHQQLLRILLSPLVCAHVMVCGFPWGMYDQALTGTRRWWRHDFKVVLRGGRMGRECVWVNYDADTIRLHDYRYFGANKKVRQDLRRLVSRTVSKLRRLDPHRRQAVLDAIARDVPSTAGATTVHRWQADQPSAAALIASAPSSLIK